MTPDDQYNAAVELATGMARVTTREKVLQSTWTPFQLLYVELAKRKEITPLAWQDKETKEKYWREVRGLNAPRFKKIWICQALLIYDLITKP